jgi:hypothetical protein
LLLDHLGRVELIGLAVVLDQLRLLQFSLNQSVGCLYLTLVPSQKYLKLLIYDMSLDSKLLDIEVSKPDLFLIIIDEHLFLVIWSLDSSQI